jgi:microcin C transport system substrate-binding protein
MVGAALAPNWYVSMKGMGEPKYKRHFSCLSYANPNAPKGGNINLYTSRQFDSFNPFIIKGVSPEGMIDLVFARLMKAPLDNGEVAYPYVAEKVEIAKDSKSVVFHLNPKAKFHDGSAITTQDVKFSFEALKKKGFPIYRSWYNGVKGTKTLSERSIRFVFHEPSRDLPFLIGKLPILSKTYYEKYKFSEGTLPPLGSGPYKVKNFTKGGDIVYERVKKWWGENLPVNKGHYNFDTIRYMYFATALVGFEAFKKGDIDWWKEDRISNWVENYNFQAVKEGRVLQKTFKKPIPHGLNGFFINTRRTFLNDWRVRRALNLLFNFEWLNQAKLYNVYTRNNSIFMDTEFGSEETLTKEQVSFLKKYDKALLPPDIFTKTNFLIQGDSKGLPRTNKDAAMKLLKEAGWTLKDGKLKHKRQKEAFSLDIVLASAGQKKMVENFVKNLAEVGITAHILVLSSSAYYERFNEFDFDLILNYHPPVYIPGVEQQDFWSSEEAMISGTLNLAGVENKVVDDLVKKIVESTTISKLKIYTSLLDRVISAQYYLIPGWVPEKNYVSFWNKVESLNNAASFFSVDTWWKK